MLPKPERNALIHADEKLEAFGPQLGYPHTSSVRGFPALRELRPRAGPSPWRTLYLQLGQAFVVAAIAPDGESDRRDSSALHVKPSPGWRSWRITR
ncbi:MAG: type II toxin-antitoxin system RelE/ParE family toxin [Thermoanaerobaculia bacterium]